MIDGDGYPFIADEDDLDAAIAKAWDEMAEAIAHWARVAANGEPRHLVDWHLMTASVGVEVDHTYYRQASSESSAAHNILGLLEVAQASLREDL